MPYAAYLMTRKDSEKEAERPHYYSQFWLDVAAGRRIIGAPKPNEDSELVENEPVEAAPARKAGRASEEQALAASDGRTENIVHPVAEPVAEPEEYVEPEEEESFNGNLEDSELQNVDDSDIPDMDLGSAEEEEEEEEEDFFDEEEEEEEEEDWGGRGGRKKAKPTRPTRPQKKPARRDTRRGY
jgi:hypothetical protein